MGTAENRSKGYAAAPWVANIGIVFDVLRTKVRLDSERQNPKGGH
jgi:hypothetical protein